MIASDAAESSGLSLALPIGDPSSPAGLLQHARSLFARSAEANLPSAVLGSIVLRPDQIETVRRVRAHLRRDGGSLLADDVGTGKTYVALAVAREWQRPLVVVPASLRTTWEQAARRADVHCSITSHESLSRGCTPTGTFDAIVVDESHRFRPTSRRHAELARLSAHTPLLLISATPLQNRARELAAQLALFLGELAYQLESKELTRWIVRSVAPSQLSLPRVAPPRWIAVDADDADVLRAILALPPPPRAADAGDGGSLLLISLVRAWASSQAALLTTIRRRQRTLIAIEQCHDDGRIPTRVELKSWRSGGDVQLGFASLLVASRIDRESANEMAKAIVAERRALDALSAVIGKGMDPDGARVAALRALRSRHDSESILAFSESASTVRAYFAALRADPGVGMLTASEARIATGRIGRDEILARFAPSAQGRAMPVSHQRVTLLLSTDLLSEGVNLQDASVVVHLDLPWNPTRLIQRIGRVRRPGGTRVVSSYLIAPPAHASVLLRAEARLRAKLARAERTIGRALPVLPALVGTGQTGQVEGMAIDEPASDTALSSAELRGEVDRLLARWRCIASDARAETGTCVVSAVRAADSGWIALLDDGRLIACQRGDRAAAEPTDSPDAVVRALRSANGPARDAAAGEHEDAMAALARWLARDWSQRSCGLGIVDTPVRRRVLGAIDAARRHAPRHRRAGVFADAALLRRALAGPLPLGLERALDELVSRGGGDGWLGRATELLARDHRESRAGTAEAAKVRALILLGRGRAPTSP